MGLTMGTGPFGKQPAGTFNFEPDAPKHHALYLEPSPRRVRGVIGGDTVVDSADVMLLHETGHLPVWYFPRSDVRFDLLEATEHSTHCPFKGDARYWTIRAGGKVSENKVWGYPELINDCPDITDRVAFYWDAVDHWYEEDEEVFVHPRDPYHRVDIIPSSRTVKVSLDGVVLAESSRPMAVFETNLPTRWYLPKEDIAADFEADDAQHGAARTRARRPTGRSAATRTSPGATRARSPSPRRCTASSRSTTRSSTSTSTASARSAATRPSPRPGATHSDEHHTGDARGDARAPYRHRPRELPPRRP